MTAEESAALMTRAVKLGITITDILFETAEERREDLFLILQRKRIDLTTVTCKSSKDHSKPRNEVDTSLKSPV